MENIQVAALLRMAELQKDLNTSEALKYNCPDCNGSGFVTKLVLGHQVTATCHCGAYKCPDCGGSGWISVLIDGYARASKCKCGVFDRMLNHDRLANSGLQAQIENKRFDNYIASEPWQTAIKNAALKFAEDTAQMFYVGGQTGAGKTHICTALSGVLINRSSLLYVVWPNLYAELFSLKYHPRYDSHEDDFYTDKVNALKNVGVLYIDDFFKKQRGAAENVTKSEVEIAFEIINYRYNNPTLKTIISSEFTLIELISIDEALAGRIAEKCGKDYFISITAKKGRNYRFKDFSEI